MIESGEIAVDGQLRWIMTTTVIVRLGWNALGGDVGLGIRRSLSGKREQHGRGGACGRRERGDR